MEAQNEGSGCSRKLQLWLGADAQLALEARNWSEKGNPKSSIGLSLCNINRIYSMFKCVSHRLEARLRSPHR